MSRCRICGTNLGNDLFAAVTREPTCSICTIKYVGGDFSDARIAKVRSDLGLKEGEFLKQDNAAEAARILGKG